MRRQTKSHIFNSKLSRRDKWLRWLKVILLLGVIVLLWQVWVFTAPKNCPLRHVKIVATYEHVDQSALHNTIAPFLRNGFFYLNVFGLKRELLTYPWIYAVSIQRQWPDTISITIAEQTAVARWGSNNLVNAAGTIFSPPLHTFPTALPIIFGPDDQQAEIFLLYQKISPLLQNFNTTVQQLILNSRHYWEIYLVSGTVIYLKESDPLQQLDALIKIYPKIVLGHEAVPKSIDLRYNNGLAVHWE